MKKLVTVALLVLFCALGSPAQTSNSLPFTAVTPPPPPVLTTLGNLSPTGKIYTGQVMPINGTGFTASCVVNVDGIAQPASSFVFSSATLINFTVPASLGSSSGTAHTLTVSCAAPALTLNSPVTLPNATVGVSYSASLATATGITGGVPPYAWTLSSGSLPTGLSLSPSGAITGTPQSSGSSTFGFTVTDSSGLTLKRDTRSILIDPTIVAVFPDAVLWYDDVKFPKQVFPLPGVPALVQIKGDTFKVITPKQ